MPIGTGFSYAQPYVGTYESAGGPSYRPVHETTYRTVPAQSFGQPYALPHSYAQPQPPYGPQGYPGYGENTALNSVRRSRGEPFRPVDPFSRRRTTEPVTGDHPHYPIPPPAHYPPYGYPLGMGPQTGTAPPIIPPTGPRVQSPTTIIRADSSRSRSRSPSLRSSRRSHAYAHPSPQVIVLPSVQDPMVVVPSEHSRGRRRSRSSSSRWSRGRSRSRSPPQPLVIALPHSPQPHVIVPSSPSDHIVTIPGNSPPTPIPDALSPSPPSSPSSSSPTLSEYSTVSSRRSSPQGSPSRHSSERPTPPPPVIIQIPPTQQNPIAPPPVIIPLPPLDQRPTIIVPSPPLHPQPTIITRPSQHQPVPVIPPYVYHQPPVSSNYEADIDRSDAQNKAGYPYNVGPGLPHPVSSFQRRQPWWKVAYLFATDTLPRQLYLNILLHLPALYYSRVTKVFTDAELCLPDIEKMAKLSDNDVLDEELFLQHKYPQGPKDFDTIYLLRFKSSWEEFIDHIVSEWQVQNVVSVLLLSAVLTLLQIDDVGQDPLSRSTAVFSLLFALMSLLHGCVLMARFGSMKKLHKAAIWAEEARQTTTRTLWNVWVFLSMPAVWLAWSVIAFLVTLLSYVWRTGANEQYEPLTYLHALGFRVTLSVVFAIGLIYFLLVLKTLAQYGSGLERRWNEKVVVWKQLPAPPPPPPAPYPPWGFPVYSPPIFIPTSPPHSSTRRPGAPRPPSTSPTRKSPRSRSPSLVARSTRSPSRSLPPKSPRSSFEKRTIPDSPSRTPETPPLRVIVSGEARAPTEEHVSGPYEKLLVAGERAHIRFDHTWIPLPDNIHPTSPRTICDFSLTGPYDSDIDVEKADALADNCVFASEWNQFISDLHDAWQGKLVIPGLSRDELLPLRKTIVNDVLRVWNTRYFASRGLKAVIPYENPHVWLYNNYAGSRRVLNGDGFTATLVARSLSAVSEEGEQGKERLMRQRDSKMMTNSSSGLESPRSALPYLPQLHEDEWPGLKRAEGSGAPGSNPGSSCTTWSSKQGEKV